MLNYQGKEHDTLIKGKFVHFNQSGVKKVRVRPQSYLFPAVLLICLFFCKSVYSEKKNNTQREGADRDLKFYNSDYKKRAAGSNGDIISYNKKNYNAFNDEDYDVRQKQINSSLEKDSDANTANRKKNDTLHASSSGFVYYIVKNGDTLFGIAKRSKVSVNQIQAVNGMKGNSKIYKGMKLKIPSGTVKVKADVPAVKSVCSVKPRFLWPLKKVKGYTRDGGDGVKPIGIVIKGIPGGEVVASEDGVVKKVGYMRGYGNYIVVKHDSRYITVYSNLLGIDVKAGDPVVKGCRIGSISDDMTLHFQIDREGKPENPIKHLPGRG